MTHLPHPLALLLAAALLPGCLCVAADAGSERAAAASEALALEGMAERLATCEPSPDRDRVRAMVDAAGRPPMRDRLDPIALADFKAVLDAAAQDGRVTVHERKILQHRFDALAPTSHD